MKSKLQKITNKPFLTLPTTFVSSGSSQSSMRSSFSFIYHNHLVVDGNLDDNLDEKKIIPPRCWWLQKAALWSWCYRAELNEGKLECCSDRKENETGQKKYPNASLPVDRGGSCLTATSYSCHKPRGGWMLLDSNTQIHKYKYNTKPHISATNPGEADCCQSQHDR